MKPHQWYNGVKVRVLPSSVVDRGFGPISDQTKDYKIGICCFSAKNTTLRIKSKGLESTTGAKCLPADLFQ